MSAANGSRSLSACTGKTRPACSRQRSAPLESMSETRSTPQTSAWGNSSRMRAANFPVPQPTSSTRIGRPPETAFILRMSARCDGPNRSHCKVQRS